MTVITVLLLAGVKNNIVIFDQIHSIFIAYSDSPNCVLNLSVFSRPHLPLPSCSVFFLFYIFLNFSQLTKHMVTTVPIPMRTSHAMNFYCINCRILYFYYYSYSTVKTNFHVILTVQKDNNAITTKI